MMSQPASASTSAWLDQDLDGLVVEDFAVAHQPVMAVARVGVERDVAQDADLRHFLLDRAHGAADQIVRIERLAAVVRRASEDRCRETARGTGCRARRRVPPRAPPRSTVRRSTPGMEGTGTRVLAPSTMNIGQIRSSAVSTLSRTMRRAQSLRRMRRRRMVEIRA